MGEQDSLVFLANVALQNRSKPVISVHRKRKDTRPKELKVFQLNGIDIAEVNHLKNLPMNMLCKIFVEKFEDVNLHCSVYVCKFGVRNGCNMKFMDIKENKIHRLEHLIQCHLLEHLIKTKSDSLIEIPKKFIENMKTNKLTKSMIEIDHSNSAISTTQAVQNAVNDVYHRNFIGEMLSVNANTRSNYDQVKIIAKLHEMNPNDHSYATNEDKKSSGSAIAPEDYPMIKSHNIKIDELFPSSVERSEELTSFMMYEALHQPVNIFIIDGQNLIVEKLPIVGSEVEVLTDCDIPKTKNFISPKGKIKFACSFCPSEYLTKKSLNLHIRKNHNDSQDRKKPSKRKTISNESARWTQETETNKKTRLSSTSEDANNHWFFDLKENFKVNDNFLQPSDAIILKTALTQNASVKRPIINISNVWNNINVQYV